MGRLRCAGTTVALLAATLTAGATAIAQTGSPPVAGAVRTVTLITGDRVITRDDRVVSVRMAKGREHVRYWQYRLNDHDHVVPDDAVDQVRTGVLDTRLFDVTGLVQQGYDDQNEPVVPTIVRTGPQASTSGPLGALGLATVDTPKSEAARVWRDRVVQRSARPEKIWLNGRVTANLDRSVPQVGAPAAWQAGFRGDGVKVAVLDTGYDAAHPDLKSAVDAAADFTGEGDARRDGAGHGTHVASTIAGGGERYKGVAPGARLLVGKVLNTHGGGRESWIIAGMRWAVDQGARVINMSLGGGTTDGSDLMSQTLNQLSESSGALFVVAAGNSGRYGSVSSPGTADRALTVGSVTKSDELSVFSSRGPRAGNYGLKPEISAPGSDIVAARAAGTLTGNSVDEHHARISGTSMATPHVAGAAAILAGQHPDWTGEQIKSALVGSAKRLPGIDTHAQGAGRLDVARAVSQGVRADGLLAFGDVPGKQTASRKAGYTNDTDRPVRLALELDVRDKDGRPSNLFTLDQKTITVPPRSSAAVTVSVQAADQPIGEFTGVLRARGDAELNTPLTGHLTGAKHELTVRVLPRGGEPRVALVVVQNEATGREDGMFTEDGTAEFTVPTGPYRVAGMSSDTSPSMTMFVQPVGQVGANTEFVVDTRLGGKVIASLDDPEARHEYGGGTVLLSDVDESGPAPPTVMGFAGVPNHVLYVMGGPRMRGVSLSHYGYWTYPTVRASITGEGGYEFRTPYEPWPTGFEGRVTGRLVDVGEADAESINRAGDLTGAIAMIVPKDWSAPYYPPPEQLLTGLELLKAKGARAAVSFFTPQTEAPPVLPTVMAFAADDLMRAQELMRRRPVELALDVRRDSPIAYFLADRITGQIPAGHEFRYSRAGLGRIDRHLVDTLPDGTYRFQIASWTLDGVTAGAEVETRWPQRRTDYVTPAAAFTIVGAAGFDDQGDFGIEQSLPVVLNAGKTRTNRMFGAPFGPELTTPPVGRQDGQPVPWAYRQGDQLNLSIPMFADANPDNVSMFDPTNRGSTVLYKDGRQVARRDDRPALGRFDLPRGPGRYRLVVDAERPESAGQNPPLSTKVSAEWAFRTGPGTDRREALPLLDIRFDLPLDDNNTAAAGSPLAGTVDVAHQPGARSSRIREVQVEVSYDDGRTWQRATVSGKRLNIPAGGNAGGFASLRATAKDDDGNSVTETIIHAYALKG